MCTNVESLHNIGSHKIRLQKPMTLSDIEYFKVTYDKKMFLIQTGPHHIAFRSVCDIYDNIIVTIKEFTNEFKYINMIESRLQSILCKYDKKFKQRTLLSSLKADNTVFRTKNNKSCISVFDKFGKHTDLSKVHVTMKVRLIVQIEKVWSNTHSYGVHHKLHQIQVMDDILENNFMFTDEEIPDIYIKMKKMGIPPPAVIQKMKLDGCSDSLINIFSELCYPKAEPIQTNVLQGRIPPPPPKGLLPPPPPPVLRSAFNPMERVLNFIKNGNFQLKKAVVVEPKNDIRDKILKKINTSQYAPSLDDIINARNNLKKPDKLNFLVNISNAE